MENNINERGGSSILSKFVPLQASNLSYLGLSY